MYSYNRRMVNYTCDLAYPVNVTIEGVNQTLINHKKYPNLTFMQASFYIQQIEKEGKNYTMECVPDANITCLKFALIRYANSSMMINKTQEVKQ